MQVFKVRGFARFARSEGIGDGALCDAVERAERGLVDAVLGGSLIKQRVARPGQGRSGGYRVIVAYHSARRAVFLYGFGKSERGNISADELASLRVLAARLLALKADRETLQRAGVEEVQCG